MLSDSVAEAFGLIHRHLRVKISAVWIVYKQSGTNNTQNVANLGDNWRKVRWRHLVPNEP